MKVAEIRKVAVVVPTWNGQAHLADCLDSLSRVRFPEFDPVPDLEIIVVDNGSTDGSAALLDRLGAEFAARKQSAGDGPTLSVVTNERNLGFAEGVNCGIRVALAHGCEGVALFNDDAIADAGWLAALLTSLGQDSGVGIATGRLLTADGRFVDTTGELFSVWGIAFPRDRDDGAEQIRPSGPVFGATGGASLYRSSMLEEIGLFDAHFFAYYEDADLSFRAQLAGWSVHYTEEALAYHRRGETSSRLPGFTVEQTFKNIPMLFVKNIPARLMPAVGGRLAVMYPLMLANAVRRGNGGPALRGAIRGMALTLTAGLSERRRIQRTRVLASDQVRALLWPELPPGQLRMRKVLATAQRLRKPVQRIRNRVQRIRNSARRRGRPAARP